MDNEIRFNIQRDKNEIQISIEQLANKTLPEIAVILEALTELLRNAPNIPIGQLNTDDSGFFQRYLSRELRNADGNWLWNIKD
jgi:hypothetical protein